MLQSRDAEHFCAELLARPCPSSLQNGVRASLVLIILFTSLAAATARADVRIDGHGFGHGAGLAQYGAFGYARDEGRDFRWILDHYYPGTSLETAPRARLRVRLKEAVALRVTAAAAARGVAAASEAAQRAHVPLRAVARRPGAGDRPEQPAHARAPDRAGAAIGRRPAAEADRRAENNVSDGRYRGALVLARNAANVVAIDDVDLEQYLYGVVPAEMPATGRPRR